MERATKKLASGGTPFVRSKKCAVTHALAAVSQNEPAEPLSAFWRVQAATWPPRITSAGKQAPLPWVSNVGSATHETQEAHRDSCRPIAHSADWIGIVDSGGVSLGPEKSDLKWLAVCHWKFR